MSPNLITRELIETWEEGIRQTSDVHLRTNVVLCVWCSNANWNKEIKIMLFLLVGTNMMLFFQCMNRCVHTYTPYNNATSNCFPYICPSPPLVSPSSWGTWMQNECNGCSNRISQENLIIQAALFHSRWLQVDCLELTAGMRQLLCNQQTY